MRERGLTFLELLIALGVLALAAAIFIPNLYHLSAGLRTRLAAGEVVSVLTQARMAAIRHRTRVGVRFVEGADGEVSYRLYRDADADGVRTADILRGIDPPLGPERRLQHFGGRVGFGFPAGIRPRDPGDPHRFLDRLDDPLRFNRSNIASFDPMGGSTPGSAYLSDGLYNLVVVRVLGLTGRVRTMTYDQVSERWW